MDWTLVEKLAHSVAWSLVALLMFLVALPVLHGRLGDLIKAVLASRDLPKTLQETIKEQERLPLAFKEQIANAKFEIDETALRIQGVTTELATIQTELKSYQSEAQADALAADSRTIEGTVGAPDVSTIEVNQSTGELFETAMGKWVVFTNSLEKRLKDAGNDYDMRKISRAAYALTVRRLLTPRSCIASVLG
ncbi:MAG: hypothetical protein HOO99_04345 [Hyphomicrobiaceae bacterium]|nr:hypothetical protein [Hyphomicrobiaceae bacterium]